MIDKLAHTVKKEKKQASEYDEHAIHTLNILIEEFGAVFPDEKHLVVMTRKLKDKQEKVRTYRIGRVERQPYPSMHTVPLHRALRWGFFETAKAIAKLSPVVTLHMPTTRITALENVIFALSDGYAIDIFSMVKFVVEELKEPVLPGEAGPVTALLNSSEPEVTDIFEYLLSKGWNPLDVLIGGDDMLSLAIYLGTHNWKRARMVDLLLDAGVPLQRSSWMIAKIEQLYNTQHMSDLEAITEWRKKIQN
jgi:hypothetical protein